VIPKPDDSIFELQNSDHCIRMLKAQRRLYSDAKHIHNLRISVIIVAGILSAFAAALFPNGRMAIGITASVAGFIVSALGAVREKRKIKEAASIQELFDTTVFNLAWNGILVARPTASIINEAARRYRRDDVRNWYANTGSVQRPLDILICQRTNLSWGISIHRAWAASVAGFSAALLLLSTILALSLDSPSFLTAFVGFYAPIIPSLKELLDIHRSNTDGIGSKQEADSRALEMWRRAIESGNAPREEECRQLQDRILLSRQSATFVPDWFYRSRKKLNEATMHMDAQDYVDEATSADLA
jgi:hypothetical protein